MTYIFVLIGADFTFCLITTIVDASFKLRSQFLYFFINFLIFTPLIATTVVLLLYKRKKQCIAAGFLYIIVGIIIWLYKIIYFIYLMLSEELDNGYMPSYGETFYLISFLVNLIVVFFRLGATYLIKLMFTDVCLLEEYIHEKEHAELIQSLANKVDDDDDKLCEDEDIIEDMKNPFITGRGKKGENEAEEIHIESTL